MNNDDPRLGLPSGSSALQDQLCYGRWQAQRAYLEMCSEEAEPEDQNGHSNPDDMDDDAEAGKRIHKLYAGEECPEATEPEKHRATMALAVDTEMHNRWAAIFEFEGPTTIQTLREHRWWLKDESGNPIYSGQTDLVKIRGEAGGEADILLGDLKGLWGYHDNAVLNQQIRRYVALIGATITDMGFTGLRSAAAYLNQPAKTTKPVLAQYEQEDIQIAILEMHSDIAAMMDPNAPRTPGPVQCHHCKAKLICPEYIASGIEQLPTPLPITSGAAVPDKSDILSALRKLSGERLASLIPWLPALENTVALAKSEAKRRLRQDVFSVPGYRLKKNSPRRKIVDLILVWTRLHSQYGISAVEFMKLCTITLSETEQLTREYSHLKGKALISKIEAIVEGATMPIQVSDSLEKGEPEFPTIPSTGQPITQDEIDAAK